MDAKKTVDRERLKTLMQNRISFNVQWLSCKYREAINLVSEALYAKAGTKDAGFVDGELGEKGNYLKDAFNVCVSVEDCTRSVIRTQVFILRHIE